jgi:hypothetical protein
MKEEKKKRISEIRINNEKDKNFEIFSMKVNE